MIESLEDLANQIRAEGGQLYTFMGETVPVLRKLVKQTGATTIAFNSDITPFAKARDKEIKEAFPQVLSNDDYYLLSPNSVLKPDGHPYHKFTPYYETHIKHKVRSPITCPRITFAKRSEEHTSELQSQR